MALVKSEHLQVIKRSVSQPASHSHLPTRHWADTHLLRTPPVDDLLGVLRFLPVLPGEIYDECSVLLILAHVDRLHVIVPASAGGLPLALLSTGRRRGVFWMTVLARALGFGRGCGI